MISPQNLSEDFIEGQKRRCEAKGYYCSLPSLGHSILQGTADLIKTENNRILLINRNEFPQFSLLLIF
jgi:hypothetical protein